MSKLSFRARALDVSKPMPVYRSDEIPDLPDFAAINRAVPQMPTGMEKEEESEHHLQRALSAQQVYGTAEALVIPVPEISNIVKDRYQRLYCNKGEFKLPKQYVHVQAFGMDQEIPDYDMDSEDETWLTKQAKKMDVTPLKFENMMDRLEKGSGQMVVTVEEAKALLKEDDDLIIAVYDYWLNKRLRTQNRLIPQVKTEKRDGSTTNDPYVAFRRRTEKMQTRKNRKNDEVSYEKMLKLRRDLNRALIILEMMKRREKSKKELLQLTIEIYEKRYQLQDWSGTLLGEALAQRHKLPPTYVYMPYENKKRKEEEGGYVRKKREYKNRKHRQQTTQHTNHARQHHHHHHHQQSSSQLPQYHSQDLLHQETFSSDDEQYSPISPTENETEDDPDGVYAFKRKANCSYHAPISDGLGNWPWCGREEGGFGEKKYRYCLMSLTQPRPRCVGFARRRVGRGGRILIDRAVTEWDDYLTDVNFSDPTPPSQLQKLISHIKENRFSRFRPKSPAEETEGGESSNGCGSADGEFNAESFHSHQEALLAMQRHQMEVQMKAENTLHSVFDLDETISSQQSSKFTLDSASAQFAASAVCNSTQELLQSNLAPSSSSSGSAATSSTATTTATPSGASSTTLSGVSTAATSSVGAIIHNGPLDNKTGGLSVSRAATLLHLNLPTVSAAAAAGSTTPVTSSVSSLLPHSSPAASSSPVIGTKSLANQGLYKLAANTSSRKHDSIATEKNHEGVNNIVKKDQVVAMEVT